MWTGAGGGGDGKLLLVGNAEVVGGIIFIIMIMVAGTLGTMMITTTALTKTRKVIITATITNMMMGGRGEDRPIGSAKGSGYRADCLVNTIGYSLVASGQSPANQDRPNNQPKFMTPRNFYSFDSAL
jgi:hypothetical protein